MNTKNLSSKDFWDSQSSSFHRLDSKVFYDKKANEHAQIIQPNDRESGIIDLGCGAGELIEYLNELVNIEIGIDFSSSMIRAAKKRIKKTHNIKFLVSNTDETFDFLKKSTQPVWTTAGALNQYLNLNEIKKLMEIFNANEHVRSFYLFDCVDPIRYKVLDFGCSYLSQKKKSKKYKLIKRAKIYLRRLIFAMELTSGLLNKESYRLGLPNMGYGHLPQLWLKFGDDFSLHTNIVSSRFYEYRYHVIYTKD
tara:strand:+ start:602 stop:1354 length:753 start_codon:yes stop_codon:yes gene_type:complete